MARSATDELGAIIERLQSQRQEHADAIERIDGIFARYGIQPAAGKKRGRPAGRPAAAAPKTQGRKRRRRRGRFGTSGTASVLDFVRQAGKGGASSRDISKHWKSEGRAGEPYITLGQLVKGKKLKKQAIEGGRGSKYTLA